jgi:hypothetical protein
MINNSNVNCHTSTFYHEKKTNIPNLKILSAAAAAAAAAAVAVAAVMALAFPRLSQAIASSITEASLDHNSWLTYKNKQFLKALGIHMSTKMIHV